MTPRDIPAAQQFPTAQDMAGRVAVVTGGGRGVGAVISRELTRRGAHVVVNYFHSSEAAAATVEAIERDGGSAEAIRASVAKPKGVDTLFDAVATTHGGMDILINNAARGVFARYDDLSERDWQRAIDTNVHGARRCTLRAAPLMVPRGGGAIVNVSSIGACFAMDNYLLVGVCKAALEAMTRYFAADLGPLGIRVNTASAGLLDNATAGLFPGAQDMHATSAAAAPLGRLGTEEELARLVGFLASPQASWISGQSYLADGGLSVGRAMLTPHRTGSPTSAPAQPAVHRSAPEPDDLASSEGAVAVVGMGLVAPGAKGPEGLWDALMAGIPGFSEPHDRFTLQHFWSPGGVSPDRSYCRVAGYIHEPVDRDTAPPAQDYLTRWLAAALRQCGAAALAAGCRAACYMGAWNEGSQHVEESLLVEAATTGIAAHWPRREDHHHLRRRLLAALRQNYRHAGPLTSHLPHTALRAALDGQMSPSTPLELVDTACSSSLYAIDLGVKGILDGDCDVAFCGGAFSWGPRHSILFSRLNGLSRSGGVRPFDNSADGVLFSDGAGVIALKRLDRARMDGDRIFGVLAGFGPAADGRGKAPHASNRTGQTRALARAWSVNGLGAEQLDWVVAHATGTPSGDETERAVLCEITTGDGERPLCTSNKAIVGHTGWAAGVLSVIHALQGLRHGQVPPQIPYRARGDESDGSAGTLNVPTTTAPLPAHLHRPRTVGVSAFGFGGTAGHLLVQDPPKAGALAPRALPKEVADDPAVLVAWSAHLPEIPDEAEVAQRLNTGRPPSAERSFGTSYPAPDISVVRMPPRTAVAIDRAHLMALQVTARLAGKDGEFPWQGLEETTGVFTACTGVAASSADLTVRCYAESLTAFASAASAEEQSPTKALNPSALEEATAAFLAAVRERCPAPTEDTLAGLMPNVISGRIAAAHDLHGPTMTLDTGPTSGRNALRTAEQYLRYSQVDLAVVLGVNAGSSPLYARCHNVPEQAPAEGAFAVVVTRASLARARGWPVLSTVRNALEVLPDRTSFPTDRTYLAADDLVDTVRHVSGRSPVGDVGAGRQVRRLTLVWEPADLPAIHADPPAVPDDTLILTDTACEKALEQVTAASRSCRVQVVCSSDDVQRVLERALAQSEKTFRHLRVVISLHQMPSWPALPEGSLLALHDASFLAARDLRDALADSGTFGIALLTPYTGTAVPPHAHLFSGLIKSLNWEWPLCTARTLLTDTGDAGAALSALEAELACQDGYPVVARRDGQRYGQRIHETERPATGHLPLDHGDVVVASGGARGITAACLTQLARTVPLRLHLLGSSSLSDVPQRLLDTPDADLASARVRFINEQRAVHPDQSVREINARFERLLAARESHRTLGVLRELCGEDQVHFHTCDVTDTVAVHRTAKEIRQQEGRVDLLIHAAGLHQPGEITRKHLSGIRRIRDVKLYGYHNLRAAFDGPLRPRLWCNFGSAAGVLGLPGESDYSAANDFLSGAAHMAAARRDDGCAEHTLAWPVWHETGLATSLTLPRQRLQLSRMSTEEGVARFLEELSRQPGEDVVAFAGTPEQNSVDRQFPGLWLRKPPLPRGLLGIPVRKHRDRVDWLLELGCDSHPVLGDHLVDGKPTLPGALLIDIALQAARTLAPGLPARIVEDATFTSWVRARGDGRPARYKVTARRDRNAAQTADPYVTVTLTSDVTTAGGDVLVHDRVHFEATVLLEDPPPPTAPQDRTGNSPRHRVSEPYYLPGSPVELNGIFRATTESYTSSEECGSLWRPTRVAELPDLDTPVVLLDSLARTLALQPDLQGRQTVAVPRSIARVVLYAHGSDADLLHAYPDGIVLRHWPAEGTSKALTPEGRVLAEITGMQYQTLARLDTSPHVGTPTR